MKTEQEGLLMTEQLQDVGVAACLRCVPFGRRRMVLFRSSYGVSVDEAMRMSEFQGSGTIKLLHVAKNRL